jgi:hypothetical protein
MKLKVKPVEGSEIEGNHDDIVELSLGPSGLRIVIATLVKDDDDGYLEAFFYNPRGFRYLDEGDLLAYWKSGAFAPRSHSIFEITSGGWMEQERRTQGMLDTTNAVGGLREWFIVTTNGCLNVIANTPPLMRKLSWNATS